MKIEKKNITIIGLGYIGLPLAIKLNKYFNIFGFDISKDRILLLKKGLDLTNEVTKRQLLSKKKIIFTDSPEVIKKSDIIIVTVPTPIKKNKKPDFSPLFKACEFIGKNLKENAIIIFESTVYPGATRELCVPIIERYSKKKWKKNFFVGYSPERANVGDKSKSVSKITKLISGDSRSTVNKIKNIYKLIVKKLYATSSIEIAEAAKSIENIQRDVNISLMNEFAIICNKLNLSTKEIIDAASTKWNFYKFTPGLVGGHCISVDPYYLIKKSTSLKYFPKLLTTARSINESFANFLFYKIKSIFKKSNKDLKKINFLILGVTFKENCNDIRNSKIFNLIALLKKQGANVTLHDPYAIKDEVWNIYSVKLIQWNLLRDSTFDMIILANPHKYYFDLGLKKILKKLKIQKHFFDIKSAFDKNVIQKKKINYWNI
jgi:UDP-N-acetyl-D-galactosamine dehydrogenase